MGWRIVLRMRKAIGVALILLVQGAAFSHEKMRPGRHVSVEAETRKWSWRPVELDEAERGLLTKRSDPPKTALDYYLLLPEKYFRNIENSLERRITFIDQDSLSDQYLHAEYSIPRTDAGAFEVTIRVFHKDREPLIAIRHRGDSQSLYKVADERTVEPGELVWINVGRPEFWRYRKGEWIEVDRDILPGISKDSVLDRYHHHYQAHLH